LQTLLLKLSGEALGGASGLGIDHTVLEHYANEIRSIVDRGIGVAVVLGGGNLFRGAKLSEAGMDRVVGDRMGMLATIMNGLALGDFLRRNSVPCSVFSASAIAGVVQGYDRDLALAKMRGGQVVIVTGGTGNPYFTTDTAACLRGVELQVDTVLKGTNVDGVYSSDPNKDASAIKFDTVSFDQVLEKQLGVMDLTAIVLCKENNMPLVVFDASVKGALLALTAGQSIGTKVVQ
jgi:uridylate kinase